MNLMWLGVKFASLFQWKESHCEWGLKNQEGELFCRGPSPKGSRLAHALSSTDRPNPVESGTILIFQKLLWHFSKVKRDPCPFCGIKEENRAETICVQNVTQSARHKSNLFAFWTFAWLKVYHAQRSLIKLVLEGWNVADGGRAEAGKRDRLLVKWRSTRLIGCPLLLQQNRFFWVASPVCVFFLREGKV